MTEDEIIIELALVTTAIQNLLKTGKKYEIGTGSSRRVFEMDDLGSLRALRIQLTLDLQTVQGSGGLNIGF